MVIDIHTHAWPDKVAQKARENLESFFKITMVGTPTVETLLQRMDANAIDISVVCAVASRPEQVIGVNNWAFGVRSARLKVFASMHPGFARWKEELARVKERADGIKFQPEFQNFYVDDETVFPLYEEIERLGLPVLFHCGEELSGTLLVRSSPQRVAAVKKRFPALKIIAAHFGGFRLWKDVEEHLLGEDIYLDTAYFFGNVSDTEAKRLLLGHRADRLLFGTDFPLVDQAKDLQAVRGLGLASDLQEAILWKNASRLRN